MFVLQTRMPRKTGLIVLIRIFQCFFKELSWELNEDKSQLQCTTWAMPTKSTPTSVLAMAVLPMGQRHSSCVRIAQLYTACFALDSFRRKTWSDDPGSKMAFLPRWPQPRHLERDELQSTYMRARRQEGHLGIEPPSRRATRHHHFELEKATAT